MVKQFGRRRNRRFECHQDVANVVCQGVMMGVWQLDWDYQKAHRGVPPDPYMKHWENCVIDAADDDEVLQLQDRGTVIALVGLVKHRLDDDISKIKDAICAHYDSVSKSTLKLSDQQAELALSFATKLWLHASPDLSTRGPSSFRLVIKACLPERSDPNKISGHLTNDFCAKHLWRKGGIRIVWTDEIEKHLTSHKGRTLHVFRNSSMLRALQQDPNSDPFPDGFVSETLQTLYLLFRPLDSKKARRNIRYMEKHLDADLELAMGEYPNVDLQQYPYWHEQLAEIQRMYDHKTPSGLVQWWFDRRDRVQWTTFWVAFLVLVLTVCFGIISSITGIWQVYLAYRS
ncbi:hypothetical protein EPUS_08699 [Endocarpon pusillum Z07020]|uniref:Uncharacterized protein n=1 Tax=Endocarpon pusillum (strain Z07020 / HMAS-L-300199) TaxID=1263415 RepID=U1GLV8_ENDPU|nr:uncharacterized protein EPUS_08699 [Endocarpon pusillum Z07020]ERF72891.1 hypothetical protein EPUS_08699 [Endocarpon pusillum Z07020]